MRFKLIDEAKKEFPVHRLCNVLGVSESGYFACDGPDRKWGADISYSAPRPGWSGVHMTEMH